MFSSEFKGLFASVATASKANNENAGFLTPRIQKKMTSSVYNENKGFVTPRNKNILTTKTLFSDKAKVALGDCKNTAFNTMTPMKNGNVFIEKTKSDAVCQPATPKISNISSVSFLTPTPPIRNCESQKSELEIWNENLMLSEDQFSLLFMESNEDIAPPMPSPEPVREFSNSYVEFTPTSWINFDYESTFDTGNNEDDELPSLNSSFDFSDSFRD